MTKWRLICPNCGHQWEKQIRRHHKRADRFGLPAQIACIRREIDIRGNVYPSLLARGKMQQDEVDYQMAAINAVLETLEELAARKDPD